VREHNDRAWLAWNTARLMHFHHQPKKLPRLDTLLVREGPKPRQSSQQQLQVIMAMHAAFGATGRKGNS